MLKQIKNKKLGVTLSAEQLKMFDTYYQILVTYNEHTNLTRITERKDVDIKHFYDSLSLAKTIDLTRISTLCDMGSGAGFPSIPLKIIYPELKVTIIDSAGKRIAFLKMLVETLNLNDVQLVYNRIEKHAAAYQESFDLVIARALGKLPMIIEMGVPMLKVGGMLIAYKGQNYESEILNSKRALQKLGSKLIEEIHYTLPLDMGNRAHLIIEKKKHVSGYPRNFTIMKKKPL